MKPGVIVSVLVASLALGGMVFAFINNASPYVSVSEARQFKGDSLHVVGDIVPKTLSLDMARSVVNFTLKDTQGETVPVTLLGAPPSNMGSVTRVVAVGGMKGDHFEARKLIIKCPSKYEGTTEAKG